MRRQITAVEHLDDPHAEAAIGWMVEMASGEMSERKYRMFEAWLHESPGNEFAWTRLQEGLMPCGVAARQGPHRGILTSRLLQRQPNRRAFLAGFAGLVGAGTVGLAVADRFLPMSSMLADHVTLTAQREHVRLADGSELVLAPRTAVDIRYEHGLRAVRLINGELMVRVAARAAPFQLCADGIVLQAASGAFVVEKQGDVLSVCGVEGAGRIEHLRVSPCSVAPGDRIIVAGDSLRRETVDIETVTDWVDGLMIARNRSVASIVARLRPYFPGVIRLDPAVEQIHATGVFALSAPQDALDALASSLGLSITRVARYWVSIGP